MLIGEVHLGAVRKNSHHFVALVHSWTKRFFAALWLVAVLSTQGFAGTSLLPVKLDEYGRITIPVTLEGGKQEQYFLLDTAARRSLLLNKDSGLSAVRLYQQGTIRHFSSHGLLRLPAAVIAGWKIGDRLVGNSLIGLYPDNASARGLVGNDDFVGHILHWAPKQKRLGVYTNTLPISTAAWHNIGGKPNRHFSMMLKTEYQGEEITVLVATGTSRTLLDNDTASRLSQGAKNRPIDKRPSAMSAIGLGFPSKSFRELILPDFKIGAWSLGDIKVLSARVDVREITGFMDAPVMILGADILLKHEVAFDFRDYQLWVHMQ